MRAALVHRKKIPSNFIFIFYFGFLIKLPPTLIGFHHRCRCRRHHHHRHYHQFTHCRSPLSFEINVVAVSLFVFILFVFHFLIYFFNFRNCIRIMSHIYLTRPNTSQILIVVVRARTHTPERTYILCKSNHIHFIKIIYVHKKQMVLCRGRQQNTVVRTQFTHFTSNCLNTYMNVYLLHTNYKKKRKKTNQNDIRGTHV